jgi:hypothetical protein
MFLVLCHANNLPDDQVGNNEAIEGIPTTAESAKLSGVSMTSPLTVENVRLFVQSRPLDLHTALVEEQQINSATYPTHIEQTHHSISSDVDTSVPTYGITELLGLDNGDYFFWDA